MSPRIPASDALFGKTRQAVLALLFGNPARAFYTREIVHAAGGGTSQVQRELDRLARSGLVRRERRANQVYFQANSEAAIYPELVGLVTKSFGIADILREAVAPVIERVSVAFIFGSVARNEQHATSDIDVLVIGDSLLSDFDEGIRRAESRLGRQISVTLLDRMDYRKRLRARDHFLTNILSSPKIFLIGDAKTLATLDGRRAR
jgi:predicted nucleotidyltransferase